MLKDEIKPKRKLKKGVLVDVDDDCLGCAKCKNICPMHVFEMIQQKSVPVRYLDCTHCNMCTDICSQNAITIQHNPKEAIQIAIRHKDRTSL
jgi:formate hydrogenlyase subunit 6/NADH:ubiquinone oxidoreductase subunit I